MNPSPPKLDIVHYPVAALEIGRRQKTRAERRARSNKTKNQLPKRRKFHKGGHNKDKYHR